MKRFLAPVRNDGGRRPTVLVADDHAAILEKASTLLARNFDVVASVTDGQQALEASLRLDPDVVVLDVSMPELSGLQVARALRRAGSRTTIVMLTMHESNEFVVAAIESGAQGYVRKTRMHLDLESAIDHALAGRTFLPFPSSLLSLSTPGGGGHALQLRLDGSSFLDELSGLLSAALSRGDMAATFVTEATRVAIEQRLVASGWDLVQARDRGTYFSVDAAAALSDVLGDRLDTSGFVKTVDDLERARLKASASHLTMVGEMSALLVLNGKPEAAMQRERAWDDLTRGLPFLTVCSYPMGCFGHEAGPELFGSICASHGSVCHSHPA